MSLVKVSKKIGEMDLIIETGQLAKQADGSVMIKMGGNILLVTACMSPDPLEGNDFFPLTVMYQEKYYAAGKIPGGYVKRESKPSDNSVLISRLTDRPIRPLFPKDFMNEVQVVANTLSSDMINPPDILSINGASAALAISKIPFLGPVGGCRIVYLNGKYIVNPSFAEIQEGTLDIVSASTREGICMVEGGANLVSEEILLGALELAHNTNIEIIALIEELAGKINPVKFQYKPSEYFLTEEKKKQIHDTVYDKMKAANSDADKLRRAANVRTLGKEALAKLEITKESPEYKEAAVYLEEMESEIVRKQILDEGVRADGRKKDEIRKITIDLDLLPGVHGSALFTRGQTQSLGIITLGAVDNVQYIDTIEAEETVTKNFMLHYNFPSFSVGEVKRMGPPGRREIGHGRLAERSVEKMLPSVAEFPYTIRMVSEILESNGSSSMASVCCSSLSMMCAGIPIKDSVAGIAMGLVWDKESGKYVVLSDIQGLEDHHGDMDFKVAGTKDGITAFQMDVKTIGITWEIMGEALQQAKTGRMFILETMNKAIDKPRGSVNDSAPKVQVMNIPPSEIGAVIGPGGKYIKKIQELTEADISIEEDGKTMIYSRDQAKIAMAAEMVRKLAFGLQIGDQMEGTVVRVEDYGVFVEVAPGQSALLHKSRMIERGNVRSMFKMGDIVKVKVDSIDEKKRVSFTQMQ
ncbi:MAG: polyribonucleotide nucleotidyltransferase [Spirochaetes bacterium GWF1_51_8]|nr:MAG: polyribonucleotide nucleotidyltransferase [Spirochaetes bacterium GWF1_51_8]